MPLSLNLTRIYRPIMQQMLQLPLSHRLDLITHAFCCCSFAAGLDRGASQAPVHHHAKHFEISRRAIPDKSKLN